MNSPGLTVKPIKEMNGGSMFAEIFFEDVRVPVANRLGAEGQGWTSPRTRSPTSAARSPTCGS